MPPMTTREMRAYQARRRGGESPKTREERLKIALAWERGEITEGLAAEVLGMDRVAARGFVADAVAEGVAVAHEIHAEAKARAERPRVTAIARLARKAAALRREIAEAGVNPAEVLAEVLTPPTNA